MTGDLISREAAIEMLKEKLNRNYTPSFTAGDAFASALHRIKNLPAVDAVPVVHGRWIPVKIDATITKYQCSQCSRTVTATNDYFGQATKWIGKIYPYCHCGAKMDGDAK